MKLNYFKLLFLSLFLITSCADEYEGLNLGNDETEIEPILPMVDPIIGNDFDPNFIANFGAEISGNFLTEITDTNGNPLEGVSIDINGTTATTDTNGIALLEEAQVFENFAYIKADKDGFVAASRAIVTSEGTNYIKIQMLPLTTSGVITSGQRARISDGNGASVELDGNYISSNGASYQGSVSVILNYLDAVDPNMPDQMPGMLLGQNYTNEAQALTTLGMLSVELRGESGEELNIAPGSTATLSFPVDPSLQANAPATIPLWYFDEANGIWIEEGQATLIDGVYIGAVSHFSFWNCDIPTDAEIICINLENVNGQPISNQVIFITSANFGTRSGVTDSMGQVCGYLPFGEVLDLTILDEVCGNFPIFATTVGPFSGPETITVVADFDANPNVVIETITGVFNDCDGIPVSSGYILVDYLGSTSSIAVINGNFTTNILRCTDDLDFTLEGVDLVNLETTAVEPYQFTTPLTDIGVLTSCNTITEFISFTIDTNPTILFIDNLFYSSNNPPAFSLSAESNDGFISLLLPSMTTGTYDIIDPGVSFFLSDNMGNIIKAGFNNEALVFELINFGAVGELIDINFSGTFDNGNGGPQQTIVGEFHVIRTN